MTIWPDSSVPHDPVWPEIIDGGQPESSPSNRREMALDFGPWVIKTAEIESFCWKYYRECSFPSLPCCSDNCSIHDMENINTQTNRRLTIGFQYNCTSYGWLFMSHCGDSLLWFLSSHCCYFRMVYILNYKYTHTHVSFETETQ